MKGEQDLSYPQKPEHEISADKFINHVNNEVAPMHTEVTIEADNFSKSILQKDLRDVRENMSEEDYNILLNALNKIDDCTPDFYVTMVTVRHDDIDLVTQIARNIDKVAKEFGGGADEEDRSIGRELDSDLPEYWALLQHTFRST